MTYRPISDEQFAEWQRRSPRPENGSWWPERWAEVEDAVRDPYPPDRWWGERGIFKCETRAWMEWMRARGQRRYRGDTRKRGAYRPPVPKWMRKAVIDRDGRICGICGGDVEPDDIHVDHIHPYSLGGPTEMGNLQVSHSRCNIKKGAKVGSN